MNEQAPQPAQLPVVPSTIRDVAQSELGALTTYVDRLPLDRWNDRSAVKEWSIGDVVTHLDLAFGLYARLLGTVTSGGGSGPFSKTLSRVGKAVAPVAAPAFSALNSAIPKLLDRALAPEVVKGQFSAGSRGLQERLGAIGPDDYTRPVHYVGGPYPLSFFLAMMVNEMAIHRWDIESVLTPGAHLSEGARSVLPWLYFSGAPLMLRPPKGTAGTVQIQLDAPRAEMWWTLGDGSRSQGTGTAENADVTIRGTAGTFVLVLTGRIDAERALTTTSLSIDGNEPLGRTFLGAWKLI